MKVAIVTPEAAPFAKTGGLADVAGALPKALFRLGHEPVLIMPLYRLVRETAPPNIEVARFTVPVGRRHADVVLWQGQIPGSGAPAYFIEQDDYFDRPGIYGNGYFGYPDNCERFTLLSRAAIEAVRALGFSADLFHIHDWQTALVAPYLKLFYRNDPLLRSTASLLTIHNMSHQGIFWHWDMEVLGLGWDHFNIREFEFWNKVNLLKGGIVYADAVNTVSPTYSREIQTRSHGHGLEDVLRQRGDTVYGVVNGIDEAIWNPAADPHIKRPYGPEDLSGKESCKRALQRQVGLRQRRTPLIGIVSRLAEQKGIDLLIDALPGLFERTDLQCVVLGDGEENLRDDLELLEEKFPERIKAFGGYDETLAHRIIAGADMIVVPSRFEPCGLTQLYALKYGSVPVVRNTGGLSDTVVDCRPETLEAGTATGFCFKQPTPKALAACVERAIALYRDRTAWEQLIRIGMQQDWSWERSASKYQVLYEEAIRKRNRP